MRSPIRAITCLGASLAVLAAAAGGCASNAPSPEATPEAVSERVPTDLTVDVTVLVGRGTPEALVVESQQAKYIVEPDGTLQADAGPFIDISTRPGRSRVLAQDQLAYVWSVLRQTGFARAADANGPANPDLLRVNPKERLAIITVRAQGRTWNFVRRATGDEPLDPAAARVIRALAALAWIPDRRPSDLLPERYDYGPDPYAVYREIRERQRAYYLR
jgi:hypothetical protein